MLIVYGVLKENPARCRWKHAFSLRQRLSFEGSEIGFSLIVSRVHLQEVTRHDQTRGVIKRMSKTRLDLRFNL
jgi:hypothetical protein